jgi:hypothetical protein
MASRPSDNLGLSECGFLVLGASATFRESRLNEAARRRTRALWELDGVEERREGG